VSNGIPYCIDATEVTNADYGRFLAANYPLHPHPRCSWNTDFEPVGGIRGSNDDPVTSVDWCDAFSFCQWAGKRLCGLVGITGDAYRDFTNPIVDEWYNACSSGGVNAYPYGNEFGGGTCNGAENGGTIKPARAADTCEIGGVYDLSGNVSEWENACDGDDSEFDNCRLRGGSYYDRAEQLACAADSVFARNAFASDLGFRCCQGMLAP
jgi:formylglycine-generating enzyme